MSALTVKTGYLGKSSFGEVWKEGIQLYYNEIEPMFYEQMAAQERRKHLGACSSFLAKSQGPAWVLVLDVGLFLFGWFLFVFCNPNILLCDMTQLCFFFNQISVIFPDFSC